MLIHNHYTDKGLSTRSVDVLSQQKICQHKYVTSMTFKDAKETLPVKEIHVSKCIPSKMYLTKQIGSK